MFGTDRVKKVVRWGVLAVVVLIGGGAGLLFWLMNRVQRDLAEFVMAHPEETAVVTYTFDENGNPVEDGGAIFYNADEPLVVASVMKTAVLAAYAQEVAAGNIDPDEPVAVADWERFYLPLSDGGAHKLGLQSLELEADALGFALDQTAVVTLDDLATLMMHTSGNAATDYLLERVGAAAVTAVLQTYLPSHTPISYTLGYALVAFYHEEPFATDWLQQVQTNLASGDSRDVDRLIDLYLNDAAWRVAQIDFMENLAAASLDQEAVWEYQTAVAQLLPKATAREYAQLMAQIGSGQFVSPAVSQIMQQKMETVPSDWPLRALYFERFGAKDGLTAGVLATASYAAPRRGAFGDENRVVVLIVNGLPAQQFARQSQLQGHYLLPIDLAQATGSFNEFPQNGR
ncbi:MAG: serine hydrolase [Anaerolineales bacterium]|nr:serine hydrolase [Anaerolineales bacterium]